VLEVLHRCLWDKKMPHGTRFGYGAMFAPNQDWRVTEKRVSSEPGLVGPIPSDPKSKERG
jgi:fumarylacetoacetate (FAA) hydrolase family protein